MQSVSSPGRGGTLSEESFQCSICLEVFVEPVSTPCGHSFCKACLQGYWDHSKKFLCPMCKKSYSRRPELSINRVLAEIAAHFQGLEIGVVSPNTKGGAVAGSPVAGHRVHGESPAAAAEGGEFARAGEVPCDACIGRKMRALKSCLNCPGSFCEAHLRHHKKVKSLMSHRLVEPVHHLEEKICKKHERLLEVYCRNDHGCVCITCAEATHKTHEIVSVDREWKKKMNYLGKRRSELKHLIKERAKKLEEIKQSIRVIKSSAQKELEESWQVYAELQCLVEQSQAELVELIATRQREAERHAQELARGLESDLSHLRKRSEELEALAQNQDKVSFLQSLPALAPLPEPIDWSGVSVNTDLYLGTIQSSVSTLVDKFQEELKRLYGKELRKLQNYASEVFLDPGTAQRNLVLSEDGRQVMYEERKHNQSEDTRRFNPALFVLACECLSSGRHYWEVEVGRKTAWTVGVVRASARRKGEIKLSPDGGYWCLWLKSGEVKALASTRLPLQLTSHPQKIGIFLDYEGGQVSFYDVKARTHLFTFEDTFNESLYPIFSPCLNQEGKNAAPLIISAVNFVAWISQVRYDRSDNDPNVKCYRTQQYKVLQNTAMYSVSKHCNVKYDRARSSLPVMAYLAGNHGNLTEEQVHCSICLDVFTNPVSIPCGHNFCRCCILDYWKTTALFQCPMCKKTFFKRPDISINTVLREIAEQFKDIRVSNAECLQQQELKEERELQKKMEEQKKKMEEQKKMEQEMKKKEQQELVQKQQKLLQELRQKQEMQKLQLPQLQRTTSLEPEKPMEGKPEEKPEREPEEPPADAPPSPPHSPWGEVSCDVCMGDRMKAVKSCLVCLTSYCEEHIKNHNTRFTKHKLIEPVANLEERMCPKHERLLELFCKKDHICVCVLCTETDHRAHFTVPVEREWTDKKAQLKKTEIDVQQMIQERLKKREEIKHSVELNKSSAQREIEDSIQVFQELIRSIQRTQAELVLAIEEKQRETERWSQDLIAELEQEITELQRRNTDLEHLSRTEDHIHFLQSFPALCTPPATKDWSGTHVHTEVCVGIIRRAMSKLEETMSEEIDKLVDTELKKILKYTADLTLDPDTANPWLQLSEDRRQVRHLGAWQDLPDIPERFDTVVIVLGREGFTTGRHYWEVQVGDKDDWYLGVAKASVNRKGRIAISSSQGYWALAMKKGQRYRASTTPPLSLTLDPKPKRVGVYVDCEEGQVSFYDVKERNHIYTFMEDNFKDKLFPFFYLYCCDKQSDAIVICPINEKSLIKQC
ncbi:uncharacterized protein LOC121572746 [Coregonus clupeaformis]|uniref:uncharacterized protein LOC121572746 n=1 Tax=Coregonus clupeaformis TaxID=59861 RepID=UPI001E1C9AF7|nr:uncharacterized protein LOC121572746 [Coregonus clupeaformis]